MTIKYPVEPPHRVVITHEHQLVHEGKFFSVGHADAAAAASADIEVLVAAGANTDIHTYIKMIAGADARLDVFEAPTVTAAGTAITPQNHNRGSANTCDCTVTHTPTLSADGTQIWQEYLPGGSGGNSPGAVQHVGSEQMIMAAGETYLFRLTNLGATAQMIQLQLAYYGVKFTQLTES